MRKFYSFLIAACFACTTLSAQTLLIYDAEGSNDYTWYKSTNEDAPVEVYTNPKRDAVNSTAHCAGFLRMKDDPQHVSAGLGNLNIDISQYDSISFMVYKTIAGRVQLEINDVNGDKYWYNTADEDFIPGQWNKIGFSLADVKANIKIILIAPHNRMGTDDPNWKDEIMYSDQVEMYGDETSGIEGIDNDREIIRTELYSVSGKLLHTFHNTDISSILFNLSQGMYILKETDEQGCVSTRKMVVRK